MLVSKVITSPFLLFLQPLSLLFKTCSDWMSLLEGCQKAHVSGHILMVALGKMPLSRSRAGESLPRRAIPGAGPSLSISNAEGLSFPIHWVSGSCGWRDPRPQEGTSCLWGSAVEEVVSLGVSTA